MTAGAPTDPQFYVDLDAFGQRTGIKPEDALFVWASESGLDPTLSGNSRTFSTLMHYVAVPNVMSEEVWQRLPAMSHREQLPWVESGIYAPARRILGRAFNSAFEVYLANAAPGLLRRDGVYSDASPMYIGGNYPDNWTMDNYPAGVQAYSKWYADAKARGQKTSLRAAYSVASDLIDHGVLKGYVSLGDLKNFAKRLLGRGAPIAQDAIQKLNAVRASKAQGRPPTITSGAFYSPGELGAFVMTGRTSPTGPASPAAAIPTAPAPSRHLYVPDFDSAFRPNAPVDTRVATVAEAKAKTPSLASVESKNVLFGEKGPGFWPMVAIGGGLIVVLGVAFAVSGRSSETVYRKRVVKP